MNTGARSKITRWRSFLTGSALCLLLAALSAPLQSKPLADTRYDRLFQANARIHLPQYDWRWLKAQSYQESRYNPAAVSPVGAMGLMQIMPGTWGDLERRTGLSGQPTSPSLNIQFGTIYMGQMLFVWRGRGRTKMEKLPLAWGSYNCGAGCTIKAQRRANDARDWEDIAPYMPKESRDYVVYIRKHYKEIKKIECYNR